MAIEVPIASLRAQSTQTINLEGIVYRLTFTWNTRCLAWDMTIAEQDGTPIVSGIRLLPQINLLFRHKDPRLPPGQLWTHDVQEFNKAARPVQSDLGTKLRLIYYTEADIDGFIST